METVKISLKEFLTPQKYVTQLEYIIEILPKCCESGPWIAGGALLRTYTNKELNSDIDVFFINKEQMDEYLLNIVKNSYTGPIEDKKPQHYVIKEQSFSRWHYTFILEYMGRDWTIQCVSFIFFKNISELFDSFDFDVCMFAYDGTDVFASKTTFDSVSSKKIRLLKINYPSVTLKRLVKYMRAGYDVDDEDVKSLSKSFNKNKEPVDVFDDNSSASTSKSSGNYNGMTKTP